MNDRFIAERQGRHFGRAVVKDALSIDVEAVEVFRVSFHARG